MGVVPVIKMAAELLQSRDSGETSLGEVNEFGHRQEAKLACRLARIEEKADVGG